MRLRQNGHADTCVQRAGSLFADLRDEADVWAVERGETPRAAGLLVRGHHAAGARRPAFSRPARSSLRGNVMVESDAEIGRDDAMDLSCSLAGKHDRGL